MTCSCFRKALFTYGVCLILITGKALSGETGRSQHARAQWTVEIASPEKIAQIVRDRLELPESFKVAAGPLANSQFPDFLQSTVTTEDGKVKRTRNILVSKDGRCLVMGTVFALRGSSAAELLGGVRDVAKLPANAELTVGTFEKTPYPQILRSILTVKNAGKTVTARVFITKDHRTGIVGVILPFGEEFTRSMIKTKDVPSQGASSAPVTLVEYSDLQCPMCARLHEFVEKQLLPKYGNKVRVIFKELVVPGHDWALTAAVANECAYQIKPSAFSHYRTLIFANQTKINSSNAHEFLLGLGKDAGLDRSSLSACIDSKASMSRVEESRHEGDDLGINKTPTSFVNGRIVVGLPPQAAFDKIIDQALLARTTK